MVDKLALKRLTASDLTFFEWHFRNRNAGNQKAINLNADVFIDQLYPALSTIIRGHDRLGANLWIAGPASAEPINLQRKIIKGAGYKNWRLDGEFVHDLDEDPDRFIQLMSGDIVLLGFEGDLKPKTITLVLLASSAPEDATLFGRLDGILSDRRMIALENDVLRELCEDVPVPQSHPVWLLVSDEDVGEAAMGQAPAVARLLDRVRPVRFSREALLKARRAAEEIGRLGEELVDMYLKSRVVAGEIADYEWVAAVNAIAPHDFRLRRDGAWEKIEVKTTAGTFGREFHLPLSELRDMAQGEGVYRIVRVYEASDQGARMRISGECRAYGRSILDAFGALPAGVTPDGVTVVPDETMFGTEIEVDVATDDSE